MNLEGKLPIVLGTVPLASSGFSNMAMQPTSPTGQETINNEYGWDFDATYPSARKCNIEKLFALCALYNFNSFHSGSSTAGIFGI